MLNERGMDSARQSGLGLRMRGIHPQQRSVVALGLCYALPNVSMSMLWTPLTVMQGIYIKYYGISMGLMAVILLGSRIYDAVADVAVGSMSDWLKAKTGRRKPLFIVGSMLFILTGWFVYSPPKGIGPIYLTISLFVFFSAYAIFMISYLAWGAELARDTREKTGLFSLRNAAGYAGLCLFYVIPLLPAFDTSQITPITIKVSMWVAAGILAPALILSLRFVPEGMPGSTSQRSVVSLGSMRALLVNRPFGVLMGAYLLCGAGLGIWYGMIFIFVDIYLGQGALFAPLYLLAFGVGVLASLAWSRIAAKIGKKAAWSIGMVIALPTFLGTGLLNPANANGWTIGLVLIINTCGFVSFELLPTSILGDVVDHSLLKSGRNLAAMYFSVYMFVTKLIFALGGAVGLGLSAWLGFDAHARTQSAQGIWALDIVMCWLPSLILCVAVIVIRLIPMDERRHGIVRRRLDQLERRTAGSAAKSDAEHTKLSGTSASSTA